MSAIFPLWRPFTSDGGHAFLATVPPALLSMIARGEYFVAVLEDGVDLGPGDASHDAIRADGGGRYSLWGGSLWFSASDNSDCANNGRNYSLLAVDISDRSALYRTVVDKAVPDDATLLGIVAQNARRNNSVFGNFFRHRNAMSNWLDRTGLGLPRRIVEVGCGSIPWTGLRFLLEGTELFVATDMIKVQDSFPAAQMRDLRITCEQFDASLTARWDAVLPPGEANIRPKGLSVHSEMGFENIVLEDEVDFIMSTAVLEHVMDPAGVYKKMAEVTPRGGWMFHAIDLRDHRHFDMNPLAFLELTEAEYAPIKSENRLRASHHRALMDANGFDVVVEWGYVLGPNGEHSWVERGNDFVPGVTEAQRERFTPEFRALDLLDLSTTSVQMLCRRR